MKLIRLITIAIAAFTLVACHPYGESNLPTPTPLTDFTPKAKVQELWSRNVGVGNDELGLRLALAYAEGCIYAVDALGTVSALDAKTGDKIWNIDLDKKITSGISAASGILVVATEDGDIIVLDAKNGKQRWTANAGNQILAPAQIEHGVVLVKTVADNLLAFDANSGRKLWNFMIGAPTLILRLGSTPEIAGNNVYAGFANGRLLALQLQMGTIVWQQQIAMPNGANDVEQMVDIDIDPVLKADRVYIATYQGRIAALDMQTGKPIWDHKMSSYTGVLANEEAVYTTDADGYLWSFTADAGRVNWRQEKLKARILTAPAFMGANIVVADAEGYLHWLDAKTGDLIARVLVSDSEAISAKPLVVGNDVYVVTDQGRLVAYHVKTLTQV